MHNFIKRLFTWWNGATFGTLLSLRGAEKIATDDYGNSYYQQRGQGDKNYHNKPRRWVIYKGYAEASRIPPEWHGWLHYIYDTPPSQTPLPRQVWENDHQPNLTGTAYAYKPKGSLDRGGIRNKISSDYESWSPDS